MANASPEIAQSNETQRAETAANRFYDMAEKGPGAKDPKAREMFSSVGSETADGGYDNAQRILEGGATWDDNLRGAASEVNQLDQEKRGVKLMSLEDAVGTISRYAEELQKTGSPEDALEVQKIAAGMIKTGQEGVDAAEKALQYIEGLQKSQVDRMSQRREIKGMDTLQSLQEKRGIRDALHQEKQKRVEQMKQSQRGTEELTKGRDSTARGLEKLYADAGIPEGTASRQEFFGRVSAMSSEELHFLDSALNKAAREAMRSGDPKMLEGLLGDLSTKSFKRKDVETRQKAEDQRKIEDIRRKMGLPEQHPEKPSGRSEEEIEKSRKRIEEMMPSKGPQRMEGVAEPEPSTREAPEQEKEAENPFEKLVDSLDTSLDRFKDALPGQYSYKKAVGGTMDVLRKLYPDKGQLVDRVQEIFSQYGAFRDEARKKNLGVDESSRANFALNQTTQRLSGAERQALEGMIRDEIDTSIRTHAGVGKTKYNKEQVLESFIDFIEGEMQKSKK